MSTVNTASRKSQADGSDSDSSVFSFSVTTPVIGYSGENEWILDTGATYLSVNPIRHSRSKQVEIDIHLCGTMSPIEFWMFGLQH